MKQVVVLSIKEFEEQIEKLFSGLEIQIFSKMDIEGHKNVHRKPDLSNWFGGRKESDYSVMFFMFVADDQATKILDAIKLWNEKNEPQNPVHAYEMDVARTV